MNKHQVKGMTNQATGAVKKEVGKLTGDRSTQARGAARELKGSAQKTLGDAKEAARSDREMRSSSPSRRRTDR